MPIQHVLQQAGALYVSLSQYLNLLVIALVIILTGFVIGKLAELVLRRAFTSVNLDERLARVFKARRNYARALRRTIVRLIYLIAVIAALRELSLDRPVLIGVLFLLVLAAVISLFLASLDLLPNLLGHMELRRRRFALGDEVIVVDPSGVIQGVITDMTLQEVHIRHRNGDVLFVPNAAFLRDTVTKRRR